MKHAGRIYRESTRAQRMLQQLRNDYAAFEVTNQQYRYFTRLNNRRRTQTNETLAAAGYKKMALSLLDKGSHNLNQSQWGRIMNDLLENPHHYDSDRIFTGADIWFARDRDLTLFILRFSQ